MTMLHFQRIAIPSLRKVIGNSQGEGEGVQKLYFLKEIMKPNWNFFGGVRDPKKLSVRGVWIFFWNNTI